MLELRVLNFFSRVEPPYTVSQTCPIFKCLFYTQFSTNFGQIVDSNCYPHSNFWNSDPTFVFLNFGFQYLEAGCYFCPISWERNFPARISCEIPVICDIFKPYFPFKNAIYKIVFYLNVHKREL